MTSPALHPRESLGDSLRAAAGHILSEIHDLLAEDGQDKAVVVHGTRKSLKRWRAMLRLLTPFLGDDGRRLRDEARELARALSTARDPQTALEAFEDLLENAPKKSFPLSERSQESVRGRLEGLKKRGERRSWNERSRQDVADYVTAASYQLSSWPLKDVEFSDLAETLSAAYGRARRAVPEDWAAAPAEDLHELRRRVIDHRYQMELIEPAWPRLGRIWIDEAQRLRDRLGAYQDLTILGRMAAPHGPLAPWRSRLQPAIAAQQAKHSKAAARVAARLFAESPKAFRRRIEALWERQAPG